MKKFASKSLARVTATVASGAALLASLPALAQVNVPNVPGLRQESLLDTIITVVIWGLSIAGAVAVLMLIVGGFLYITASGDEGKMEKAKNTIKNAIIGIVIILLALVIVITLNEVLAP